MQIHWEKCVSLRCDVKLVDRIVNERPGKGKKSLVKSFGTLRGGWVVLGADSEGQGLPWGKVRVFLVKSACPCLSLCPCLSGFSFACKKCRLQYKSLSIQRHQ